VNRNIIVLFTKEYSSKNPYRCYFQWQGEDQVLESEREVTDDDVKELVKMGVFGSGQVVNAKLNNRIEDGSVVEQSIKYSGTCDSGD
jgi:hypothetical protein